MITNRASTTSENYLHTESSEQQVLHQSPTTNNLSSSKEVFIEERGGGMKGWVSSSINSIFIASLYLRGSIENFSDISLY